MPLPSARCRAAICFCLGLFLAIPAAVIGQTTNYYAATGTEYAIAGSLPGDQVFPDVAVNGTNGGYIVWQDNITDPVGEGIAYIQVNGTLSGSSVPLAVNTPTTTTNNQQNARVALLKNGGAAFVWQGGPATSQHIYARFLNGSKIFVNSTNVRVSTFNSSFQGNPAVATLLNSNVIVVWNSYNQAGNNSLMDVYGQILAPDGTAVGGNFLINQTTAYNQRNPTVAALTNGGFVVAWVSEQQRVVGVTNSDVSPTAFIVPSCDIYARLFTVSGNSVVPSTGEFLVNAGANPCARPAVATAADGSYMLTWCAQDLTNPTNGWDIYERSFTNSNGGLINVVNTHRFGDQYAPRISVIGGDYLIVWTSLAQDGSREGVYGQFLHEGDAPVNGEFLVNTTTLGQQMQPTVAADGYDRFIVVWTGFSFGPNEFDLYAQRFVNTAAALVALPPPTVFVPFVISNGIYQPELVVSWPQVQGLSVSNYQVFMDGAGTSIAKLSGSAYAWTMTANNGLGTNSTHSFAVNYTITAGGFTAPTSSSASGTTWSGLNWGGIPYEWMENVGMFPHSGATAFTNFWPTANTPVTSGGPTFLQVFWTGGNPYDPSTWLQTTVTRSNKGAYLNWNTQPGMTYQVQVTTDFKNWNNFGMPRYESSTTDSVYVGGSPTNTPTGYYRVQLLWQ